MAERKPDDQVSRQRLAQRRLVAQGRCQACGRPRNLYASYCDEHQRQRRDYARDRRRAKVGIPPDAPIRAVRRRDSPATPNPEPEE